MKKFIKVLMLIDNRNPIVVDIETIYGLHDLEIYNTLEKMFPTYIFVNYNVDENIYQYGYDVEYKNGLNSIAIYRNDI